MLKKIIAVVFAIMLMMAPQYTSAQKVLVYTEDQISLYLETDESGVTDDGVCVAYTNKIFPDGENRVYVYGFQDGVYVKMNKNLDVEKYGSLSDSDFDAELANMVYNVFVKYVG